MSCVSFIGDEGELGCSEALTAFKPSFNRAYVHNIISPFEIVKSRSLALGNAYVKTIPVLISAMYAND